MIDQLKEKFRFRIEWIAVGLILMTQVIALVYTYGILTDRVDTNSVAIHSIVQTERSYTMLSQKMAVISQRLKDDEILLHSIAKRVGAE